MASVPWDSNGDARRALRGIASDPHYGPATLSQPAVISNLLKDLLPDAPREAGLIVAAAQADLLGTLRGYLAQGMDARTATRLTAVSFADSSSHTSESCDWIVTELALAIGVDPSAPQPAPPVTAAETTPHVLVSGQPTVFAPVLQPTTPGSAGAWPSADGQAPLGLALTDRSARTAGITALAGAFFVLLGCALPYVHSFGGTGHSIFGGFTGEPASERFWFAAMPVSTLIAAIVLSAQQIVQARQTGLVAGLLVGFAVQAIFYFAWVIFTVYQPDRHEPGAVIGMLGSAGVLVSGLLGVAAIRREAAAAGQPAGLPAASAPAPTKVA